MFAGNETFREKLRKFLFVSYFAKKYFRKNHRGLNFIMSFLAFFQIQFYRKISAFLILRKFRIFSRNRLKRNKFLNVFKVLIFELLKMDRYLPNIEPITVNCPKVQNKDFGTF